mgnify:FL=1
MDRVDHLIEHDIELHAASPNNTHGFKVEVPKYKYNQGEIHNPCIRFDTPNNEERFKINDHIM